MEKINIGPLIKKEIKVACPNIRFQEIADLLEISYNQLFVKFRNGRFSDEELTKIMNRIGGKNVHLLETYDGRFIDLNAPEESLNQ